MAGPVVITVDVWIDSNRMQEPIILTLAPQEVVAGPEVLHKLTCVPIGGLEKFHIGKSLRRL